MQPLLVIMLRSALKNQPLLYSVLVLLMLFSFAPTESSAQLSRWLMPDSVEPTESVYNIADDEFPVGALTIRWFMDPADSIGVLWDFYRYMNTADWIWFTGSTGLNEEGQLRELDTMMMRAQSNERVIASISPIKELGGKGLYEGGQMIEVFFFDSVQAPYFRREYRGVDTNKGEISANTYYDNSSGTRFDWPWAEEYPRERKYTTITDSGLIAEHLTIRYDPVIDTGWTEHIAAGEDAGAFLHGVFGPVSGERKLSIALKGHLGEELDPGVNPDDVLFRIEIYHVIPPNHKYLDDSMQEVTVTTHTERLIDTFSVVRSDLQDINDDLDPLEYRDVSFTTDLRYRFDDPNLVGMMPDGYPGWWQDGSTAFDVKIYWTGKEEPSLRSLMLRNSQADLLYGTSQGSVDLRQDVVDAARRVAHGLIDGTNNVNLAGPHRTSLLRFDTGHETFEYGLGTFRAINRLLTDSLIYNNGLDSIPAGIINHVPSRQLQALHIGEMQGTFIEYGYMDFGFSGSGPALPFGNNVIPFNELPAIAEHNGGRNDSVIGPPLIELTTEGVEMYTESLQRGFYGYYTPVADKSKHAGVTMQELGEGARAAAKYGTRLYGINGTLSTVWYDTVNVTWDLVLDTLEDYLGGDSITFVKRLTNKEFTFRLAHQPEVSELRAEANLLLCMGGDGLQYYSFGTDPNVLGDDYMVFEQSDTSIHADERSDTITWGSVEEWSIIGPHFRDAVDGLYDDVSDVTIQNHQFDIKIGSSKATQPEGKFTAVFNDIWTGWESRAEGVRDIAARTKVIGTEMLRLGLEWRDAYSIHHQAVMPNSSDTLPTFPGVRTLAEGEILVAVSARHPVTGVVDSAWNTYVEVGLFYTKTDTATVPDPLLDSNFLYVVNRRTFERPADVLDTIRAPLMDELSETREIALTFNLKHPDSTQYAFVRVREVLPDSTTLPIIGPRPILDTVVYGDSAVLLTLGAGEGALLEVTFEPGDASIVDGDLRWNNQRKMIYFDDDRYHSTYLRNDSVFYRRSLVTEENPASILWESPETLISIDSTRTCTQNWAPSITGRVWQGDTVITIVWTCHSNDSTGVRDVVLRDVGISNGGPTLQPIRFVDYHAGTDSTLWGDAVVSSMLGGDVIAWGDSLLGVVSRIRLRAPLGTAPAFSNRALVSQPYHDTFNGHVGRWPSVPTFAHRAASDSNVAIVWVQPVGEGSFREIYYHRVLQNPIAGGVPGIALLNFTPVTWAPQRIGRPSIDQTQDVWWRLQEGITWVEDKPGSQPSRIWYRSMWTEVVSPVNVDTIKSTYAWSSASVDGPQFGINGDSWPNTASVNDKSILADSLNDAHFSIAWVDRGQYGNDLWLYQAQMQYAMDTFRIDWPRQYTYDGDYPHGSASPFPQQTRHAVLYETNISGSGDVLRTTRQFFGAKSRPTGYMAKGRRVIIPIDHGDGTHMELLAHDAWYADDVTGTALHFVPRDPAEKTDSLNHVEALLRTGYFAAGDSTAIGLHLAGSFFGDSATGGNARISLVAELVDSASGMVVAQLDSIAVSATADSQSVYLDDEHDLLSATYYIRVRLDTANLTIDSSRAGQELIQVAEHASRVESPPAAKFVRWVGPTTGNATRISAQPNPMTDRTEIRFSIYQSEKVTITLLDESGREVATLLRGAAYEAGRYAVELDAGQLPSGSYLVQLRTGEEQVVERVVIQR